MIFESFYFVVLLKEKTKGLIKIKFLDWIYFCIDENLGYTEDFRRFSKQATKVYEKMLFDL